MATIAELIGDRLPPWGVCAYCGGSFHPRHPEHKYCRARCRRWAQSHRRGGTCGACGGPARWYRRGGVLDLCDSCDHIAFRSCLAKIAYPTLDDASHRWVLPSEGGGERVALYPYLCSLCKAFHCTSTPPYPPGEGADVLDRIRAQAEAVGAYLHRIGVDPERVRIQGKDFSTREPSPG